MWSLFFCCQASGKIVLMISGCRDLRENVPRMFSCQELFLQKSSFGFYVEPAQERRVKSRGRTCGMQFFKMENMRHGEAEIF
ncbi:hypothetical protein DW655_12740 [Lachnospiraceae bacterium AM23-2LB]|nr:hypothetical protein DW655_12740 [Lachnospiraceae bacterium AM23-2LB]RJW01477.1 hypothetical protein DW887_12930 [Lachnospiraceae bacterium AM40-2BH]